MWHVAILIACLDILLKPVQRMIGIAGRVEPADTTENHRCIEEGRDDECLLAYRTKGEYWDKERTVIVTYTPASARKQAYTFADKLEAMRQELLVMRAKVRDKAPHWRNEEAVRS